jgi:ATP-dependent DNA helicase RecG
MLKDGRLDLSGDETATGKQQENNKKTTRKTTGKQPDINNRILAILDSEPTVSRLEMAKRLSISEGSLRHHLEKMKNENLIKREGSDKGGKWIIIKL